MAPKQSSLAIEDVNSYSDDDEYVMDEEAANDDDETIENEDGTATFISAEEKAAQSKLSTGTSEWFANLAEEMDQSARQQLATHLVDLIEKDKASQSNRDKLYADGLAQTGLTKEAPGGADFPGASRATHPMILEAAIDSAAQIYKELQPADGPCKIKIVGDKPDEKMLERAERVKTYMNYQLTDEIQEYEEELDQCLSQVPLAGSQFMKFWWDPELDRIACEYIPQDKFWLPYTESGMYSAKRKTHYFDISQEEFDRRVAAGLYIDAPYTSPSSPDETKAQKAVDKIQGETPDPTADDQNLEFYESYVWLETDFSEGLAPYICTIRVQDNECVALRRNWEEDQDDHRVAMDWVIEYPYIRWRGSLTLGLMSVIGGLSKAATGALRALLDSAFVNNTPSLMKMKGARFTGQTQQVQPVGINEIEASPGIKDIRQLLMAFPYNPPSPVLYELLGFLVTAGKGVVTTAEEKIAEASNQMPMGTALALIEQGGKVFSSIHKRLHKAQHRALQVVYRINRMYLTKARVIAELGELTVRPEDFAGPCPIVPVSDPNIFSDSQRVAQLQGVMQLAAMFPDKYDLDEINDAALQLLKVPDPDRFRVKKQEPQDLNPVAENLAMAMGGPAQAFPAQDHLAHLQAHLEFYKDPAMGQNPLIMPVIVGQLADHVRQHCVMLYAQMCYEAATSAAGQPVEKLIKSDPEHRKEFDRLMAIVAVQVGKKTSQVLEKAMPLIQQLAQQAQQMKPPMPMDPTAVQAKAVEIEAQRVQQDGAAKQEKTQADSQAKVIDMKTRQEKQQQDAALEGQKLQQTAEQKEADRQAALQKEREKQAAEDKRAELRANFDATIAANAERIERERIASDAAQNTQDNVTAIQIAAARAVDEKEKVGGMSSGSGVTNPNP